MFSPLPPKKKNQQLPSATAALDTKLNLSSSTLIDPSNRDYATAQMAAPVPRLAPAAAVPATANIKVDTSTSPVAAGKANASLGVGAAAAATDVLAAMSTADTVQRTSPPINRAYSGKEEE